MKNCLIMGFGRSGTSLMGGILHDAGYYLGDDLYPPRHSNPKGFFENAFINGINEQILRKYDYSRLFPNSLNIEKGLSPYNPGEGHRWLTYINKDIEISNVDESILKDIKEAVSYKNFAYKDPRFNYTLNVWNPFLEKDVQFLCVFREPAITINSVKIECETAEYLSGFSISSALIEEIWCNSYLYLLKSFEKSNPEKITFIHYKQLLSGEVLGLLSDKLEVSLSSNFISGDLNRVRKMKPVSSITTQIYRNLCKLASYYPPEI
nr:hypothetical protein [Bacteroidota bacterium]